jgi:cellobiose phosphorylase
MPTGTQVHYNKQYLQEEIRQLAHLQQATLEQKPLQSIDAVLSDSKSILTEAYRVLARAAKQNRELSSAAEWIIDNFYIIQEQIVQLKEDLPEDYYKKLPRLTQGEYRGYPRTYEIVQMLAAISDNIIDQDNTITAIKAYQEIDTLNLAEMWSVPLMNRLALIVRLSERAEKLLYDRQIQDEIDKILKEKISAETEEPGYLLRKLSEIVDQQHDTTRFLIILAQRLQMKGMLTETERRWFDYKFSRWDTTLEEQLRDRAQQTSRLHLSIQNAISSLRDVSETDWSDFVETCSVVERILRFDPADKYAHMDFNTRDTYRKRVEKLSSHSRYSEQEVAEQALMMAESAAQNGTVQTGKKMHIGYYLIDEGYHELAKKLGYKMPLDEWLMQKAEKHPGTYFSIIILHLATLLVIAGLFTNLFFQETWFIVLTILAAILPALDLSIVSSNRIISFLVPPRILPKLEFENEIPDEYRTIVVVPTLFNSSEDVEQQFEQLEIRALANANDSLQFALLSDFHDASSEHMDSDESILQEAQNQVNLLNNRYHSNYGDKFLLFHRKRLWNPGEEAWMGWERKRGKIEEFNRLLINPSAENSFITLNDQFLNSIRVHSINFVITLDADTKLPPGSAKTLIGAAAHPLNRPELDESNHFVKRGYGIFQPRISIPPKSANKTLFARVFSGNVGLDPYTTAVSDVYQDLFGEGVYTGKGIYDVHIFDEVIGDRFPENAILSHDLLESTYLRSALLTDIELFDDYPTTYLSYSKRQHRWIRGDWQILSWLWGKVTGPDGQKKSNPINVISRWKIFDNLRRSLNPVGILLFLLFGWILLPGSAIVWTLAVFGVVAFPIYSSFSTDVFRRPKRVGWKLYFEKLRADLKTNTLQSVTSFLFLPHQAYISLDAIFRTLYRMFFSHKKLLEWTTATQVEQQISTSLWNYWISMWANIFWAGLSLFLVAVYDDPVLFIAIPVCIGWVVTPYVAYYLEKEPDKNGKELKPKDLSELKGYARRTWHFFEQYMNEEHSWLPPDNVQEDPYIGPVGRTSPTNIGLALVSIPTAYEMGYITLTDMIERLENTLNAMLMLDRYRGHFYNWYSTRLGAILSPNYVSTVDSGNLAASLLVVQRFLQQIGQKRWLNPVFWDGLDQTVFVLEELVKELDDLGGYKKLHELLTQKLENVKDVLPKEAPEDISDWQNALNKLHPKAKELGEINLSILQDEFEDLKYGEWKDWFNRPCIQIDNQLQEIRDYLSKNGQTTEPSGTSDVEINFLRAIKPMESKLRKVENLASICRTMVEEMDFKLVYNSERELFSIGFNVEHAMQDKGTYDLLASEARLASFIAIAKGDVPPEHWFRLSRRLTSIEKNEILLSWGGTIFEYLMPLLFMSRYDKTLLSHTYEQVVKWQKDYGNLRRRPWGFSESGYNILSLELHYQYRAFGAPGLGLRRGLAEDYVVAPYAGMLAMMIQPVDALKNLRKLKEEGAFGPNGFYEAVDYTPGRLNNNGNDKRAIVKMYMAHHQGMSLLALANVLRDNFIQHLFHSHPLVQACELLLQERIPRGIPIKEPRPIDVELEPAEEKKVELSVDHAGIDGLNATPPRTHILSNGRYSTVLTHTGTGYSYYNDTMLTRWRSDVVQDPYGKFFYVRDLESGEYWSIGHQPVKRQADRYDSWYHAGKVQYARVDEWIESFMEVCVSPEDDIELRKITLTNYSDRVRKIELTSFAEVALNDFEADRAHTAFSNLFVQTEYIKEHHAVLAKRRPRGKDEESQWLVHTIASEDIEDIQNALQIETERSNFIGRNRSLESPAAMDPGAQLSGMVGNVRDPILSIRRIVTLEPGQKKNITFGLGWEKTRDEAISMADRYDNPYATDRVFELASIYGSVELEHLGLSGERAHYFQNLSGYLLFNCERFRADVGTLQKNRKLQSDLWTHGISGDVPILVYHIEDTEFIKEVALLLKAHAFWRHKGLRVDIVFMNDHPPSYVDELQEAIMQQVQISSEHHRYQDKGRVFLLRSDQLSAEDRTLIDTVARVVLKGKLPKLDQITLREVEAWQQERMYDPINLFESHEVDIPDDSDLMFYNGYGGFNHTGTEYVIRIGRNSDDKMKLSHTPAPWINVISNPQFGFITSESGSDFTWSRNSRENKLTPWSNDAVTDPPGEVIYIRDEDQQLFWSPTPGPVPGSHFHEVRHGFGYSIWRSKTLNIEQEITKWVDKDDPIKIIRLRLVNTDLMPKTLSVFRYLDWVLGIFREDSTRYLTTAFDEENQTIFARNYFNNEFAGRVGFTGIFTNAEMESESYTADRAEFIGRNRNMKNPLALGYATDLEQRFGVGFEACAAIKATAKLDSGGSADFFFYMGETTNEEEARKIISKYRDSGTIRDSFEKVKKFWTNKLGRIKVQSPVPELNFMANGWLQYQNIACRMWARSGFYQASGAFGFRDQLQDAAAACYLDPDLSRSQILLHAGHQFLEGDVLHWWHPPTDRGIRSRISDDLLWLPYVTAFYINHTGDEDILDENIRFLKARQLQDDEHEAYLIPEVSSESATLYEHCCRAIDRSLTSGIHGLPLIGSGDWNDGMNNIGTGGKGESVWLGFFLYDILGKMIPVCKKRNDDARVEKYQAYRKNLKTHLNKEGWDGQWYRRAFYDDGTPIGSSENMECRIDGIAQAWSVISGVATPDKAKKALSSADELLVSETDGIIRLLTPAFDKTEQNPGYIKGYIPGVRENGGQYTHAALWLVKAFAEKGNRERAVQLIKMLLPVNHALEKADAEHYLVEPYAVAADIYGENPLTGVGGWTWYTGSAGWMYRVIIESVLGLNIQKNNMLQISPLIYKEWKRYSMAVRELDGKTEYYVEVLNPQKRSEGTLSATLDGKEIVVKKGTVKMMMERDGKSHKIKIIVGSH